MKRILLFLTCVLTLFGVARAETYTLELTAASLGFNSSSYANNNGDHTVTATASNNATLDVVISSNQVYLQSGKTDMQWQKTNGYLQNKTDLGEIKSITITSSAGGYTVYQGTSEGPSSSTVTASGSVYNFSSGNGFFKIKEKGTATGYVSKITIVFELGTPSGPQLEPANLKYSASEASVTLGETPYTLPTLSFDTNATITYASSNTAIATVNIDGTVTPLAGGKTTITASTDANDTYAAGSDSYELTVIDPNDIYTEITPTFFNYTTASYGTASQEDEYGVKYSANYYGSNTQMQFNTGNNNGKGSGVNVIQTNKDYIISTIDIEMTNNNNGFNIYTSNDPFKELTKTDNFSTAGAIKLDDKITTSTSGIVINAKAFAVHPSSSNAMYIQKITVHYKKVEPQTGEDANLSFEQDVYNVNYGAEFTAPTLNNVNKVPVVYSSSDSRVATVDAQTGEVSIYLPGSAEITASVPEDNTEYYGSATYTLNVNLEGEISVASALDLINKGYNGTAQVKGLISQITENSAQYKNATYYIVDELTDNAPSIYVYRGKWLQGSDFNGNDEIEVGGTITVEGTLVNYQNTTPELTDSKVISYIAPEKEAQDFTGFEIYEEEGIDLEVGDEFPLDLGNKYPVVTYNFDEEGVISISENKVKALSVGIVEVTASWDADENWKAGTAEFIVNVSAAQLGEIIATVSDGQKLVNNGTITISEGTIITFKAKNATSIELVTADDNVEDADAEGDELAWTPTVCNNEVVAVTAYGNSKDEYVDFDFTLTVTEYNPMGYVLVTDVAQLGDEAEVIIVNNDATFAMGVQKTNNFEATSITTNDDTTITPTENTQIVKVAKNGEYYTLQVSSGYLYATSSSSNNMQTREKLGTDKNDQATININSDNTADITFQGDKTHNVIRFNNSNSPKLFSCYETGKQNAIKLYMNPVKAPQKDPTPELSFTFEGQTVTEPIELNWDATEFPTLVTPEDAEFDVTYTSSDTTVAEIDEDGNITLKGVAGETVITAETAAIEGQYAAGSVSYTIVILDPNSAKGMFNFTVENPYGMTTQSGNSQTYEEGPFTVNEENITLVLDGKFRSWVSGTTYDLRLFKEDSSKAAGSLTLSVPAGYKLETIEFTGKSLNLLSTETGKFDNTVWEAGDETINSVTFTASGTAQISTIDVYYTMLPAPELAVSAGADETVQSGEIDNEGNTIKMYSQNDKVIVFITTPEGTTPWYAFENVTKTGVNSSDNQPGNGPEQMVRPRRLPADNDYQEALVYDDSKNNPEYENNGQYYVELNNETTGTLHIIYKDENGQTVSSPASYSFEVVRTDPTGVESVVVGEGEVIFFDLNGRRVANPDKGIFIKVEADKVSKVIL